MPRVVEEFPGSLRVYDDGTVWRSRESVHKVIVKDDGSVVWKDVVYDAARNLELRLYKPASASPSKLLPILYFIHGGGFCVGTKERAHYQNYCLKLASELQAVVISPDYRLAPENRLPAAIEDGYAAVKWLQGQAQASTRDFRDTLLVAALELDEWLTRDVVDFERVFIIGDSSGGNIAHHLAVRFKAGSAELTPVRVKGYVLLTPFFGGVTLTKSEVEAPIDAFLKLEHINRFWRLSIPVEETKDHPVVNPFGEGSPNLEEVDLGPILVAVGGSDLLKDRVKYYANRLKKYGKKIEYVEFEGQPHGFYTFHPDSDAAKELMPILKNFIQENSL